MHQAAKELESTAGFTLEQVVDKVKPKTTAKGFRRAASKLRLAYAGRPYAEVDHELGAVLPFLRQSLPLSREAQTTLSRLGLLEDHPEQTSVTAGEEKSSTPATVTDDTTLEAHSKPPTTETVVDAFHPEAQPLAPPAETVADATKPEAQSGVIETAKTLPDLDLQTLPADPDSGTEKVRPATAAPRLSGSPIRRSKVVSYSKPAAQASGKKPAHIAVMKGDHIRLATAEKHPLTPLTTETPKVPRLSHDLSRALFNPGVYQLQDPRSRVWNFDPYLGTLMPVSEFNYDALNRYITSSEDVHLREVARKNDKRYIGSTSSMSGALAHFHFLLSAFRGLNLQNLSRGFDDEGVNFTKIQRGPSAIFLRYKDGVYAVDADKEYDSANILMSLGRSMEKLLTSDKDEFELFRKTQDATKDAQMKAKEPEAYHYSGLGQFLLRSQLDAHDPRLPGTGMFDLKTRAVAAVRMMIRDHEKGVGYQIKARFGTWESYEREYYDMMRSAFLKYSLQVRMGRMDGIFVAYHNTERLFGFQYVPIAEMDLAIHGQAGGTLGDQEFSLSLQLLNSIFNEATMRYPNQSLRFHFEAREATSTSPQYMYIFAEPVTDEEIVAIQTAKKEEVRAFEQRIFNPQRTQAATEGADDGDHEVEPGSEEVESSPSQSTERGASPSTPGTNPFSQQSNAANVAFLDSILGMDINEALASKSEAEAGPLSEKLPTDVKSRDQESTTSPASGPDSGPSKPFSAWKLLIRNIVNATPVVRPENLKGEDLWELQYTLNPLSESDARRHYLMCKNRRQATLEAPQDTDEAANFYLRRLLEMSRSGAQWRQHLDQLDANRERVVLYGEEM